MSKRNEFDELRTEEIDIAFWNEKRENGLPFLNYLILVECKNWSNPVGSIEVSWFAQKLEARGLDFGIFVAYNGITGSSVNGTSSYQILSRVLAKGIKLIVITKYEIESLENTMQLIRIIKEKLCEITVRGTIF